MALGSTQPLTEMSTRSISWGSKDGRCVKLKTLPPSCAVFTKSGSLNFLEPSGSVQACNGIALHIFLPFTYITQPVTKEIRFYILQRICILLYDFYRNFDLNNWRQNICLKYHELSTKSWKSQPDYRIISLCFFCKSLAILGCKLLITASGCYGPCLAATNYQCLRYIECG